MTSRSDSVRGTPSTSATMLTPNVRLHRRVLEELVEDDLGDHAALELDHQAHAVAVGLVPEVGDLGDLLVVDEVGDLGDQPAVAALLDDGRAAR